MSIAAIATLFYTGFRVGTLLGLEWTMLEERRQGTFFVCPGEIMKTGKRQLKYVREELLELYARLPRRSKYILDWRHSPTHFRDRHKMLQVTAAVEAA